jgi:transcriptional regulator with XRE-family HTH domain
LTNCVMGCSLWPTSVGQREQVSTSNMEKKSNPAELSRALRSALGGLTQLELATKLLLSRNYISHIEAGLKSPSARVLAQMESLLSLANSESVRKEHPPSYAVKEEQAPYGALREVTAEEAEAGEADDIADRIRTRVEATIAAAGKNVARMGWIHEQAEQHLRAPEHWARGIPEPQRRPATVVLVPRSQSAQAPKHGHGHG